MVATVGASRGSTKTAAIGDLTSASTGRGTEVGDSSSGGKSSSSSVMQQMAQQLSQVLGKHSSTATAAAGDGRNHDSNLFAVADPLPRRSSKARASILDIPRSLSHNDDF